MKIWEIEETVKVKNGSWVIVGKGSSRVRTGLVGKHYCSNKGVGQCGAECRQKTDGEEVL